MNNNKLIELMNKAKALANDVANGSVSGNDVADKLEDYVKSICEIQIGGPTERYCQLMAIKARGERFSHPPSTPLVADGGLLRNAR